MCNMRHQLNGGKWILPVLRINDAQSKNVSLCMLAFLLVFWWKLDQASGDTCNGGAYCYPPESCCGQICCLVYGSKSEDGLADLHPPQSHGPYVTYSYHRLSFWNVWYFWIIVVFVVVSCFGGCGYWRRRNYNDIIAGSNGLGRDFRASVDNNIHHRESSNFMPIQGTLRFHDSLVVHDQTFGQRHPLRFHPTTTGNTFNPPPYNEVTSKPDKYPLVQGQEVKNATLAYVYATNPFIQSLLPYNSGAAVYLSSPAESNSSSLFQSTITASNCMYPPPYSDGGLYDLASASTPGSMLSACTPTEQNLTTHFLSSISPPMATTPTSQQYMSEVTTPADSLVTSPTGYTIPTSGSLSFGRRMTTYTSIQPANEVNAVATSSTDNINLVHLVADIQSMTSRMSRFPNGFETLETSLVDNDNTMSNDTNESGVNRFHSTLVQIREFDARNSSSNMADADLGHSQVSYDASDNILPRSSTRTTLSLPALLCEMNPSVSLTACSPDNPLQDLHLTLSSDSSSHQFTKGTNTSPTN